MKSINPIRIFLFFGSVVILLAFVTFIFPNGYLFSLGNEDIRFFSINDLKEPWPREKVDISDIIESEGVIEVDSVPAETVIDTAKTDSLKIPPADLVIVKHKIQYPEGNDSSLYSFFSGLDEVREQGSLIRILHYGDSQIEGDRITSVIRDKFHSNGRFGGCGAGLIPVKDILQGRLSIRQKRSPDWITYSVFEKNPDEPPHRQYSLMGKWFRFAPYPDTASVNHETIPTDWNDTLLGQDTVPSADTFIAQMDTTVFQAWFEVGKSNMGRHSTRRFEQYRLLYTNNPEEIKLDIVINETDTLKSNLIKTTSLVIKEFSQTQEFKKLRFVFEGKHSPDIYGVALDCKKGVAVDNIGMRGSAVADFAGMDANNLSRQIRYLNTKLMILQFGVNVVPHVIDNYNYYERMYYNQLMALKRVAPDMAVLVIGVTDMSRKEGTEFLSYPNIEKIRNAQKNAAFRAGCAFWDLYEAMGGQNSMVSWVNNDPPLAESDYTHFKPAGARIVGKMIYDAIMEEYYVYKNIIQP